MSQACANCGEREGTERWADAFAATHGGAVLWCKICVLMVQLDYARERAAAIPHLERQLKEAKSA